MALTKQAFSPTDGFNNTSSYPNPATGPINRAQRMSLHTQMQTYINDTLTEALESVTDGSSGADNIGMTPIVGLGPESTMQSGMEKIVALGVGVLPPANGDNMIINGGFQINQLVKSGTVTLAAGEYGHDMWKAGSIGCTYTFVTTGGVTIITISAGTLIQVIEGTFLKTGTYCLSWSGTAQARIGASAYSNSGMTASATGGSNLSIEFATGTVSNVKFELGAYPTTYAQSLFPDELERCMRYYEKSYNYAVAPGSVTPNGATLFYTESTTQASVGNIGCKVKKRVAPSIVPYSASTGAANKARHAGADINITINSVGENGNFYITGTGFTVGTNIGLQWTMDSRL